MDGNLSKLMIDHKEANKLIENRIECGEQLIDKEISSLEQLKVEKDKYKKWDSCNYELLKEIFNDNSIAKEYNDTSIYVGGWRKRSSMMEKVQEYKEEVNEKINRLKIAYEKINLYSDIKSKVTKEKEREGKSMNSDNNIKEIFISHSSFDKEYAKALVRLLTDMKVPEDIIFCTSVKGFGVELGENFLEVIKEKLSENVLVLFLLSESFYHSKISLCEMGATWVKTNKHIPIVIPPFTFEDIDGVITGIQGLKINNKEDINDLKDKITKTFNLNLINMNIWEDRRNEFLGKINNLIEKDDSKKIVINEQLTIEFDVRKNLFKLLRSSDKKRMSTEKIYKIMDREFDITDRGYDMIDIYDHLEGLELEGKITKVPYDNANMESMMWFTAL